MNYLQYLEYIRGVTNHPGTANPLKSAIHSVVESEGAQRLLTEAELEELRAEVAQFSPAEKESLICEQVAAINRLARLNAELQTANDQLAAVLAEKTKQWMAQAD